MADSSGTLTIDARPIPIEYADCNLFIGRLHFDFKSKDNDWTCSRIPFDDAVEFHELTNRTVSMADCRAASFEDPVSKPAFFRNRELYWITSLQVDGVRFFPKQDILSLNLDLIATHDEDDRQISVKGEIAAECIHIDAHGLTFKPQGFPIRFAKHYLPLLGLPGFPVGTNRADVISHLGTPNDVGGGFSDVPLWIRYTLPNCFVLFLFDGETTNHVIAMPRSGILAP